MPGRRARIRSGVGSPRKPRRMPPRKKQEEAKKEAPKRNDTQENGEEEEEDMWIKNLRIHDQKADVGRAMGRSLKARRREVSPGLEMIEDLSDARINALFNLGRNAILPRIPSIAANMHYLPVWYGTTKPPPRKHA